MKLLKKPVFWVAIVLVALLGFTAFALLEPAQVRFVNETNVDVQNLRLSFASGMQSIPILPPGESIQGPINFGSGELTLSLDTPDGASHIEKFQFTWGPRATVVFHIVDFDPSKYDEVPILRANGIRTNVDFKFNLRTTARRTMAK